MSNLTNNTTQLLAILDIVNNLPEPGTDLPELTNEGSASDLRQGKELIDGDGNKITGTMPDGSATTPATTITKNPTITVSTNGTITATVSGTQSVTPSVTAGYIASGTSGTITVTGTSTGTLLTATAATITPGTVDKTAVSAYRYTTGTVKVKGDANLVAANIKSGTSIFGVAGTFTSDATATSAHVLSGKTAYVNGTKISGNIPTKTSSDITVSGPTVTVPSGYYASSTSKSIGTGLATIPTTNITANPTLSTSYTSGSGYKISVSSFKSVAPIVTAGYVATGTSGTVSVSGSAYVAQSTIGSEVTSTTAAAAKTIGYGKQVTVSSGYYPSARIIRNGVGNATVSVAGTVTLSGSVTPGAVTLASNTTSVTGKTRIASTPTTSTSSLPSYYIAVKPTVAAGSGTISASGTATANPTAAGYFSTAATGSVSGSGSISSTAKSGSVYYLPIATETKTATPTTATQNITPSNGNLLSKVTVNAMPTVSGSIGGTAISGSATAAINNVHGMNTLTSISGKTAGEDYFTVKATATGTAGSYTPKYTVTKAGYIGATVTGTTVTVSVQSDSTGKSIYIPKASFTMSGNELKTKTLGGGYYPNDTLVKNIATATDIPIVNTQADLIAQLSALAQQLHCARTPTLRLAYDTDLQAYVTLSWNRVRAAKYYLVYANTGGQGTLLERIDEIGPETVREATILQGNYNNTDVFVIAVTQELLDKQAEVGGVIWLVAQSYMPHLFSNIETIEW